MENEKTRPIPLKDDNYTHNINRSNERSLDRRSFMKTMVGAAGLFAASTLPWGALAAKELMSSSSESYPTQKIANLSDIKPGDAIEFAYPGEHDSALFVYVKEKEYKAYQNACTHLRCPVFWDRDEKELLCPCHHGKFDIATGNPLAGPPRRPLPEIVLQEKDGAVYAVGVKRYEEQL
ncbi:Rieske 2Fe-2S domain-containing protein [Brevibacillus sp. HB1.4B]|uniref:Rieske (2Fe-2S) protein n=1 Tax=Brevibacillus sp. HB1.4B TaxID=2738845 RepID=UPI00156B3C51|nr:Rieske (2Fe-2S) protein [Brevibacillus sp. HB1.4B]NRS17728.1 Rieske 2Fe-2S domain-containing protein [Brevibacillus sp. HB1.4B]